LSDEFSSPRLWKTMMLFARTSDWKRDAMTTGHHHAVSADLFLRLRLLFKRVFLFWR